jgi:hypothetical protein
MNDEELRSLLSSLPRERASEGFTDNLMSRLDVAKRPFYREPRYALVASLILLVGMWFGAGRWQDARQREETRERVQALRTEIEQLHQDINLLRDLAPVLYLGGDENVDLVIDMRHLMRQEATQPVSFDDHSRRGEAQK